jgi:Ca2+-binding RTX toxin-like protein
MDSNIPVQASLFHTIVAIDAGNGHALALTNSANLLAWGSDSSGQLGDGAGSLNNCGAVGCASVPVSVDDITGVGYIAAGDSHSVAVGVGCNGLLATRLGDSQNNTLTGGPGPDVILGFAGKDVIKGLGDNDALCAGNGKDSITGGAGDDYINGGTNNDTAFFPGAAVTVNLNSGTAVSGPDSDTLVSIANVQASLNNDTIIGNHLKNKLQGLAGDDTIRGLGSDDTLEGQSDNDTIEPGNGADKANGGTGADTVSYAGPLAVTANLSTGANDKTDTYTSIENLSGSNVGDTLTGSAGPNTLDGLGGPDTLAGLGDNDLLFGGPGGDALSGGAQTDTCDGGSGTDTADATCETKPGVP